MKIQKLDHVNIRTNQLDKMVVWYTQILGLTVGPRPEFSFGGAWLYAGDTAVVHLVEISDDAAVGSEVDLKLEHFAFSTVGANQFEKRLEGSGEEFKLAFLPDLGIRVRIH